MNGANDEWVSPWRQKRKNGTAGGRMGSSLNVQSPTQGVRMNRYQELLDLIQTFQKDFEKFYEKKNKSAGTRVRKHMATLKRKAQEIRNEVQEVKRGIDGPEGDSTPSA
jgi:hypothetical protein